MMKMTGFLRTLYNQNGLWVNYVNHDALLFGKRPLLNWLTMIQCFFVQKTSLPPSCGFRPNFSMISSWDRELPLVNANSSLPRTAAWRRRAGKRGSNGETRTHKHKCPPFKAVHREEFVMHAEQKINSYKGNLT